MPTTKKKQKTQDQLPAREAATVVLFNAGRPMHYREISQVALEQGIVRVKKGASAGATEKTIRSYLAGCAAEGVKFKRMEPGVFDLTAAARRAVEKARAKEEAAAASK